MVSQHVCNTNLKGSGKKAEDVIKEKPRKYEMPTVPDEEFKAEKEKWDDALRRRKESKKKREYKRLMKGSAKSEGSYSKDIKELHSSLAYSANFVMAFALSFFGGFFFSKYIMGYDNVNAMIVGIVVTVVTLVTEGFLFIISENRALAMKKEKEEKLKKA
eukprot:TRINITY_DN1292_c0_g2_i7.p1 TRINITY_DN1292_c0_g2~~TRINITY_DN1292_c0_g2_i7.p1  ORF type:complete len:160 (+),score=67.00 TRINITY_DN1292_c0_g2_i7:146-625(+)